MLKKILVLFWVLMMVFPMAMGQAETASTPQVEVTGGTIQGSMDNDGIKIFKGIPYAASTAGEYRFMEPQPVEAWEGIKDCTEYGPIFIQSEATDLDGGSPWTAEYIDLGMTYENGKMSEDSLSLNIWTKGSEGDSLPVIVFIHGGANRSGSGACEVYSGEGIAAKDVVYVTINYRLGLLGFLAYKDSTGEEVTGNYAVMDQIAALKWVQDNIAKFGGDPSNVTLAGQSAGSTNIQSLITSPAAAGLFQRAACMSHNTFELSLRSLSDAQNEAAEAIGDYTIADLRAMTTEEIQALTGTYNPTTAVNDGQIAVQSLSEAFASGNYNTVDLMWGMTKDDLFGILGLGSALSPLTELSSADYEELVRSSNRLGDNADEVLALYPAVDGEDALELAKSINVDYMAAADFDASTHKDAGDSTHKTYIYSFAREVSDITPERAAAFGAFHTSDVGYWVNHFTTVYPRVWTDTDYALGEAMSSYLVNFATTGDPNGVDSNGEQLVTWPDASTTSGAAYLKLDSDIEWVEMDAERSDFWLSR